jgi:hypothetical protein
MSYIPIPRLDSRPPGARGRTYEDEGLYGGKAAKHGKYYRYETVFYFDYIPEEGGFYERSFEVRIRFSVPLGESPLREAWRLRSLAEEKMIDLGILVDRPGWGFKTMGYRPVGRSNTTAMIYKIAEKVSTGFQFPKGRRWGVIGGPDTTLIRHQVRKKVISYFKKHNIRRKYIILSR